MQGVVHGSSGSSGVAVSRIAAVSGIAVVTSTLSARVKEEKVIRARVKAKVSFRVIATRAASTATRVSIAPKARPRARVCSRVIVTHVANGVTRVRTAPRAKERVKVTRDRVRAKACGPWITLGPMGHGSQRLTRLTRGAARRRVLRCSSRRRHRRPRRRLEVRV